jgi:hypothetical protein
MASRTRSTDILSIRARLAVVVRVEAEAAVLTRLPPIHTQLVITDLLRALRLDTTLRIQART